MRSHITLDTATLTSPNWRRGRTDGSCASTALTTRCGAPIHLQECDRGHGDRTSPALICCPRPVSTPASDCIILPSPATHCCPVRHVNKVAFRLCAITRRAVHE